MTCGCGGPRRQQARRARGLGGTGRAASRAGAEGGQEQATTSDEDHDDARVSNDEPGGRALSPLRHRASRRPRPGGGGIGRHRSAKPSLHRAVTRARSRAVRPSSEPSLQAIRREVRTTSAGTIAAHELPPGAAPKIQIPRWIQLVGLPLLLIFAWVIAGAVRHVVFLFLVASLIALLLDPIVRALTRSRMPRGIAVAIVYLDFAAAVGRHHRAPRRRRQADEDAR